VGFDKKCSKRERDAEAQIRHRAGFVGSATACNLQDGEVAAIEHEVQNHSLEPWLNVEAEVTLKCLSADVRFVDNDSTTLTVVIPLETGEEKTLHTAAGDPQSRRQEVRLNGPMSARDVVTVEVKGVKVGGITLRKPAAKLTFQFTAG
jgi:hypothetical protein